MFGVKLLALSVLSAAVFAAPTTPDVVYDLEYQWNVTNWYAGCGRENCYMGIDTQILSHCTR